MKLRTLATSLLVILAVAPARAARRQPLMAMDAGNGGSVFVKPDGTLWAWGLGIVNFGTESSDVPMQMGTDTDWLYAASSYTHAVGLKQDGTLWAWGTNQHGQLGNNTLNPASSPVKVVDTVFDYSPSNEWIAACAGDGFTAAIKADGILYSWGANDRGQLGNGTTTPRRTPGLVVYPNSQQAINIWKSVSCGGSENSPYMLAVKHDGTLWSWGSNDYGALGDGGGTDRLNPVRVGNPTTGTDRNWVSASAGPYHVHALKADGTLWSWGSNGFGSLGVGPGVNASGVPIQVTSPAMKWRAVEVSGNNGLALSAGGKVYTWGPGSHGQLGDGSTADRYTPGIVPGVGSIAQISGGNVHMLALGGDGTLWSWGMDEFRCGRPGDTRFPGQVMTYVGVSSVAAAYRHSAIITSNNTLWSTGEGAHGKLGIGGYTSSDVPIETTPVMPPGSWLQVGGGRAHSVALKTDGTLWTAGNNDYSQLGRSGTNQQSFGKLGSATDWKEVHAGMEHTLAIKADGTLWAWGRNNYGQLGDSTKTNRLAPVNVAAPASSGFPRFWVAACGGLQHSAGILSDGTLWTWGRNNYGQLGTGNNTDSSKPVLVKVSGQSDNRWNAIECGEGHTIGLRNFTGVWTWGRNHARQLGNGNTTNSNQPTNVLTSQRWIAISVGAGGSHSVALDPMGTINAWGLNASGQLGDGTRTNRSTPVPQEGIRATGISAGANHTFGRALWDVYGWGQGGYGQLGGNGFHDSLWPIWCMGL